MALCGLVTGTGCALLPAVFTVAWEVLSSEEVSLLYVCEVPGSSLADGPLPFVDEQIPLS